MGVSVRSSPVKPVTQPWFVAIDIECIQQSPPTLHPKSNESLAVTPYKNKMPLYRKYKIQHSSKEVWEYSFSYHLLSSSTRGTFYPQRSSGQDVAAGVVSYPPRRYVS